ncbi:MAG: DUF3093 family protein [Rhodoluna sp.]
MTAEGKDQSKVFSTRVIPSFMSLLPISVAAPSVALVALPFMSDLAAIAIGFVVTAAIYTAVLLNSPVVSVSSGKAAELRVGRAMIPVKFVENVEVVKADALRFEKGPGLKANAYFVNQAGAKKFVKVTVNDVKDPTPYWLFACNKAEDLVVALRANR